MWCPRWQGGAGAVCGKGKGWSWLQVVFYGLLAVKVLIAVVQASWETLMKR